jgi:hypothetical protein
MLLYTVLTYILYSFPTEITQTRHNFQLNFQEVMTFKIVTKYIILIFNLGFKLCQTRKNAHFKKFEFNPARRNNTSGLYSKFILIRL